MYYVVSPDKPYPNSKLYGPAKFVDAAAWAQEQARLFRKPLDVRHVSTREISASYGADGRNLPIREV